MKIKPTKSKFMVVKLAYIPCIIYRVYTGKFCCGVALQNITGRTDCNRISKKGIIEMDPAV